jgi:hypothetical protein
MRRQIVALIILATAGAYLLPMTPHALAQKKPPEAVFLLEPKVKATTMATRPLSVGMRLEFVATGLRSNETLILQRCGEPCNTAKVVRSWAVSDFENDTHQLVTLEEPGMYYFWIQRMLQTGEVGPVFGDSAQSAAYETKVLYTTGTKVSVTVSMPQDR